MDSARDEQSAERRYERAEETFLAALRADRDRATLTALADEVAVEAKAWNAAAYRQYHASQNTCRNALDSLTERTEVLEQIWFDIAGAFHGRPALHDG